MLEWAGRMGFGCVGRTVPGWDSGGSLDRSLNRLLEDSWAVAEGIVADCRNRHRIVAGFGMAAGVGAGSFLLEGRADCHRMAGMDDHGYIAGMADRWRRCTTERGCTVIAGSLAVANGRIPADREFHGFHTAEAAPRRTGDLVAAAAAGNNPGSSRSCCPRLKGLEVDIGSWYWLADFHCSAGSIGR